MDNTFVDELYNCKTIKESIEFTKDFRTYILDSKIPLNGRKKAIKELLENAEGYFRSNYLNQTFYGEKKYYMSEHSPVSDMMTLFIGAGGLTPSIKQIEYLTDLLITMAGEYIDSEGELISTSSVDKMLNHAKGILTLDFINKRRKTDLKVIRLPALHKEFNSLYYPYFHAIISSVIRVDNVDKDYVFLHELGHALQLSITNNPHTVPESFTQVFEMAFHKSITSVVPENLPDIFSDCFSIYFAFGTEYESTNPFMKVFDIKDVKVIVKYFKELLKDEERETLNDM